jgi:hypothetical protein
MFRMVSVVPETEINSTTENPIGLGLTGDLDDQVTRWLVKPVQQDQVRHQFDTLQPFGKSRIKFNARNHVSTRSTVLGTFSPRLPRRPDSADEIKWGVIPKGKSNRPFPRPWWAHFGHFGSA